MATTVDRGAVQCAIARIAFGGVTDSRRVVRMAARREASGHAVELWHSVDLSDLSTVRTFVASSCEPDVVYEVDFFSRNEAPRHPSSAPADMPEWGFVRGSSIIVTDRRRFCSRMVADMFVAIPSYRFESLADDVQDAVDGRLHDRPVQWALQSMVTGYSYRSYAVATAAKEEDFSIDSGVSS